MSNQANADLTAARLTIQAEVDAVAPTDDAALLAETIRRDAARLVTTEEEMRLLRRLGML